MGERQREKQKNQSKIRENDIESLNKMGFTIVDGERGRTGLG